MRRAALVSALVVLALGALLAGRPFLLVDHDRLTTTPQPQPLVAIALIPLRGDQQACLNQAVIDERSQELRFRVGTFGLRPPPLLVTIRGPGYRERERVPAGGYVDSETLAVAVAQPASPRLVTICIRNEGRHKIVLYAAADRTRSRSITRVDGTSVRPNVVIAFAERRGQSMLEHLPVILHRLTAFRPVGEWLLWPLTILFALGVPAGMLAAYVWSAGCAQAEDDAIAAVSGPPVAPLRERHPRLTHAASLPGSWVAVLVLATFWTGVSHALSLVNYFVMPQELGYVEQASQIAATLGPSTSGDPWFTYPGQLWSLVLAPVYGLFAATTAFDVAHVLAAAAIASAAIPAYLLAGRVIDRPIGRLLAAALTVTVPWLAFAGSVLAESLAYPLFVWALLACSIAIERPSPARHALALGAIALAFLTRPQLAALAPAFVVALALHELTFSDGERRMRATVLRRLSRHAIPFAVVAVAAVLLVAGVLDDRLLGSYAERARSGSFGRDTLAYGGELLAYISLGVGVLPLALAPAWIVLELARPRSASAHALAAMALATLVAMVVVTAAYAARLDAGAVEDRHLFFIVPLLMIGSAALLFAGRPAVVPLAIGGVFAVAVLATAKLAVTQPSLVSPTFALNTVVQGRGRQLLDAIGLGAGASPADALACAVAAAVVALAAVRRFWPHPARIASAVSGALLVVCLLATQYTLDAIGRTQLPAAPRSAGALNWVDRAAPGASGAGAVLSLVDDAAVSRTSWWYLAFWNERVDRVWRLAHAEHYAQPFARRVTIDARTGRMAALDERSLLVLGRTDRRFALRGARPIARDGPFVLVRAPRPYRAAWTLEAARDDGLLRVGRPGRLTLFGDGRRDRRVRLRVSARATADAKRSYRLIARGPSGQAWTLRVPRRGHGTLRATLRVAAGGPTRLRLTLRGAAGAGAATGVVVDRVVIRRAA